MSAGDRRYLRVENFEDLQSPKRPKRPTWIRSYVTDLDDSRWLEQSIALRGFITEFQKLAATMGNRVPYDPKFIGRKLGIQPTNAGRMLVACTSNGWLTDFVEGVNTSKKNDLAQKIATRPIPPSSSTSSSQPTSDKPPCKKEATEVGPDRPALRVVRETCPACDGAGCAWCRQAGSVA